MPSIRGGILGWNIDIYSTRSDQFDWSVSHAYVIKIYIYVTVPGKRVLVAQIMIFLYRRFSATTPKINSRDKTFVFVSEVSPTLCYTHAKFERVEVFLKGQARCLKTAT